MIVSSSMHASATSTAVATEAQLAKLPVRESVNSRHNVERFQPVNARYVRFTIEATNSSQPCIDELEVWSAGENPINVALASNGTKARASGGPASASA